MDPIASVLAFLFPIYQNRFLLRVSLLLYTFSKHFCINSLALYLPTLMVFYVADMNCLVHKLSSLIFPFSNRKICIALVGNLEE